MGTLKSDREGGSEGGGGENLQRLPRGSVLQTAHAQSVQHHGQVHPKGFSTTDRAGNLLSPLASAGCRTSWWFSHKESACIARDQGSIPGSGRSPGEGNGNLLQCPCLESSMDRRAWWAAVSGVAESEMT